MKLFLLVIVVIVIDLLVCIVSEDNLKDIFFIYKGNILNFEYVVKGDENFYIIYILGSIGNLKGV